MFNPFTWLVEGLGDFRHFDSIRLDTRYEELNPVRCSDGGGRRQPSIDIQSNKFARVLFSDLTLLVTDFATVSTAVGLL